MREAATLRFMLSPDDRRLVPLRVQAEAATVTAMCGCGCASIHLAVDRGHSHPASGLGGRPATESTSRERLDPRRIFWLFLFLEDGWLDFLEVAYIHEIPSEFPRPEDFEPPRLGMLDRAEPDIR